METGKFCFFDGRVLCRRCSFSVGEPSGDLHAANCDSELQINAERLGLAQQKIRGLGGPRMRDAGCSLDFELTNLAVVGFAEVLPKLREFLPSG